MESIKPVVIFTTLYLLTYTILGSFDFVPAKLVLFLFSLSPFLVIYMVIRILTGGAPSELTFEDAFYEDDARTDQTF